MFVEMGRMGCPADYVEPVLARVVQRGVLTEPGDEPERERGALSTGAFVARSA